MYALHVDDSISGRIHRSHCCLSAQSESMRTAEAYIYALQEMSIKPQYSSRPIQNS